MADQPKHKTKQLQELEQALATMAEDFPPMFRRFYLNLVKEGFTEEQAFKMVIAQCHAFSGGKLVP